jgi:phage terminase large subunit-like protein
VDSPATRLVDRLVAAFGKKQAHAALDVILDKVPAVELAALAYDWEQFWAREKQIAPATTWRSWGHLTARGTGKTVSCANFIRYEVEAGRAKCVGLAAQNEDKTIDVQIGGLIEASPPWFKPQWRANAGLLEWPNGAVAYAHTPEVPGAIRSHNFDLCWLSEVQSWPVTSMREAYLNFQFATRIGYARTIWDATPKRGHPLLLAFLARAAAEPSTHIIVRGTIHENARNLGAGVIDNLEREFGGTRQGREELLGEMLTDAEGSLVKQEWIEAARRVRPDVLTRRVIGIDPAVTNRAGNDRTGIIDAGLGVDVQAYILGDYTGKHSPSAWADIVLSKYVEGRCDCVVVETNKGGELVTSNLRAHAGKRGLQIVVVGKEERTNHVPGTVHVKEVHARGPKEDRAQPLGTAYERGRVSHVIGVDLTALEETITTWEPAPGQRSPDALDAEVHAVGELLGFLSNKPDAKAAFRGITEASRILAASKPAPSNLAAALASVGGSGRI